VVLNIFSYCMAPRYNLAHFYTNFLHLVHVFIVVIELTPMKVGPCHHGMARPQVADGGTASDMEGSCE
jgi:hypothetical protein